MAATRRPSGRRRTGVARTRAGARSRTLDDLDARLAPLRESIAVLERAIGTLEGMPPSEVDALPIEAQQQRARAIGEALLSVQRLRNAQLRTLNDAFDAHARGLDGATRRLATTLRSLQQGADFVAAAAAAIAVVANLVIAIG
jgi:hypothetical protein